MVDVKPEVAVESTAVDQVTNDCPEKEEPAQIMEDDFGAFADAEVDKGGSCSQNTSPTVQSGLASNGDDVNFDAFMEQVGGTGASLYQAKDLESNQVNGVLFNSDDNINDVEEILDENVDDHSPEAMVDSKKLGINGLENEIDISSAEPQPETRNSNDVPQIEEQIMPEEPRHQDSEGDSMQIRNSSNTAGNNFDNEEAVTGCEADETEEKHLETDSSAVVNGISNGQHGELEFGFSKSEATEVSGPRGEESMMLYEKEETTRAVQGPVEHSDNVADESNLLDFEVAPDGCLAPESAFVSALETPLSKPSTGGGEANIAGEEGIVEAFNADGESPNEQVPEDSVDVASVQQQTAENKSVLGDSSEPTEKLADDDEFALFESYKDQVGFEPKDGGDHDVKKDLHVTATEVDTATSMAKDDDNFRSLASDDGGADNFNSINRSESAGDSAFFSAEDSPHQSVDEFTSFDEAPQRLDSTSEAEPMPVESNRDDDFGVFDNSVKLSKLDSADSAFESARESPEPTVDDFGSSDEGPTEGIAANETAKRKSPLVEQTPDPVGVFKANDGGGGDVRSDLQDIAPDETAQPSDQESANGRGDDVGAVEKASVIAESNNCKPENYDGFGDYDSFEEAQEPSALQALEPATEAKPDGRSIQDKGNDDDDDDTFGDFDEASGRIERESVEPGITSETGGNDAIEDDDDFGDFDEATESNVSEPGIETDADGKLDGENIGKEVDGDDDGFGDFGDARGPTEPKSADLGTTTEEGENGPIETSDDFGDFNAATESDDGVREENQEDDDDDDFGDFGDFEAASPVDEATSDSNAIELKSVEPGITTEDGEIGAIETDDDFGDFDAATESNRPNDSEPRLDNNRNGDPEVSQEGNDDFGDFGDFEEASPVDVATGDDKTGAQSPSTLVKKGDAGTSTDGKANKAQIVITAAFGHYEISGESEDGDCSDNDEKTVYVGSILDSLENDAYVDRKERWSERVLSSILANEDVESEDPKIIVGDGHVPPYRHFTVPWLLSCGPSASELRETIKQRKKRAVFAFDAVSTQETSKAKIQPKSTVELIAKTKPVPGASQSTSRRKQDSRHTQKKIAAVKILAPNSTESSATVVSIPPPEKLSARGGSKSDPDARVRSKGAVVSLKGAEKDEPSTAAKQLLRQIPDLSFMLKSTFSPPASKK